MAQGNDQGNTGDVIAIDEVMARWQREADEEEAQLGLFAEPQTEAGRAKAITYRHGPGRPPGARNKRTERTVAFLLARHRDPREILLEMAEANVHDLAALYGCSAFEAAQEKRLAAIAVLPYVAQRQPLAIDLRDHKVVYLNIIEGGAAAAPGGETLVIDLLDPRQAKIVDIAPSEPAAEPPSAISHVVSTDCDDDHR